MPIDDRSTDQPADQQATPAPDVSQLPLRPATPDASEVQMPQVDATSLPDARPVQAPPTPPKGPSLFDRTLQAMAGGGDSKVQMADGTIVHKPMKRATIAQHILAGAIAGILNNSDSPRYVSSPQGPVQLPTSLASSFKAGYEGTSAKIQ